MPQNGVIMKSQSVAFKEGESAFDLLKSQTKALGIHLDFSLTPLYNTAYIKGIGNIYEFDCGPLSGWLYKVNGQSSNVGSSQYKLKNGDVIEWKYTCDLGRDVGGGI